MSFLAWCSRQSAKQIGDTRVSADELWHAGLVFPQD